MKTRSASSGAPPPYSLIVLADVGLRHEGDEAGLISECVTLAREAAVVPKPGDGIPGAYDGKLVVIKP